MHPRTLARLLTRLQDRTVRPLPGGCRVSPLRKIPVACAALLTLLAAALPAQAAGTVVLASRSLASASATGTGAASGGLLNTKGTKSVFSSAAPSGDYVAGATDANGAEDVFVFDVAASTVKLISHAAGSPTTAADMPSYLAGVSRSGRFVLIQSSSTDLISGFTQTDADPDLFVYDTKSGKMSLVSHTVGDTKTDSAGFAEVGSPNGAIAEKKVNGKLYPVVVWETDAVDVVPQFSDQNATLKDVYVYDGKTKKNALVTRDALNAKAGSSACGAFCPVHGGYRLSANGRFVTYTSPAHNLVDGFDNNNGDSADGGDVYLYDTKTKRNTLVSRSDASAVAGGDGGSDSGMPSANGRLIVFRSAASDLNITGGDGAYDNNGSGNRDVFAFDRVSGTTELLSHTSASNTETTTGTNIDPIVSDDGRYVTFGATKAVEYGVASSDPNGTTFSTGRDIIQLDRLTGANGTFSLVSRSATTPGASGNAHTASAMATGDGRYVAISSQATDLITSFSDNNTTGTDVYLWDRTTNTIELVTRSAASASSGATGSVAPSSIAAGAPRVAFGSDAGNHLSPFTDNNGPNPDSFVYTLP